MQLEQSLFRNSLVLLSTVGLTTAALSGGPVDRPKATPEERVQYAVAPGAHEGPVTVRISLEHQRLTVSSGGRIVGWSDVTTGAAHSPTPSGHFTVLHKDADYHSREYDVAMPHALFLTANGIAIHGGRMFESPASAGCIRVPPPFASWLFRILPPGADVQII